MNIKCGNYRENHIYKIFSILYNSYLFSILEESAIKKFKLELFPLFFKQTRTEAYDFIQRFLQVE